MANNQVSIGMVLKFNGIDGFDKAMKEIETQMKGMSNMLDNMTIDGKIDKKGIQQLDRFLKSIYTAMKQFRSIADQKMVMILEVDDSAIGKFKLAIEGAFRQALSQVDNAVAAGRGESDRRPRTKSASYNTGGSAATQHRDLKLSTAKTRDDIEAMIIGLSDTYENERKQMATISAQIGQDILQGLSHFKKSNSTAYLADLRRGAVALGRAIRDAVKESAALNYAAQQISDPKVRNGLLKEAKALDKVLVGLRKLANENEQLTQKEQQRLSIQKKAISTNSRLARTSQDLNDLMQSSVRIYGDVAAAAKAGSAAQVNAHIRPFERLQRQAVEDQKDVRRLANAMKAQLSGVNNELEDTNRLLKNAQQRVRYNENAGKNSADARHDVDMLKQKKTALNQERAALEENIRVAKLRDEESYRMSANIESELTQLRSLERVMGENSRIIEHAQRRYHDLRFSTQNVTAAFRDLTSVVASGALDTMNFNQVKKGLSSLNNEILATRKNIEDLRTAMKMEVAQEAGLRDREEGAYSGKNADERDALFEGKSAGISERYRPMIEETQRSLEELTAYQNGPAATAAEKYIRRFDEFAKAGSKVDDVKKRVEVLSHLYKEVGDGIGQDGTTDDLRRIDDAYRKTGKEGDNLVQTIRHLEAELAQLKTRSSADVEGFGRASGAEFKKLEKNIDEARKAQERLLRSRDDSLNTMGGAQSASALSGLRQDLDSGEKAVREFARQLGGLEVGAQEAMRDLDKLGPTALAAAADFRKLQSTTTAGLGSLNKLERVFKRLEDAGFKLSASDQALRNQMNQMRSSAEGLNNTLARNASHMERQEKMSKRVGQSFSLYSKELADSIAMNFRFVHAIGLITSGMFALRAAFTAIVEESRSLAKTMTALESASMSTVEIYDALKEKASEAALAFGVPFEDASTVIYEFASAGLTLEEAFAGVNSTLETTLATGGDVATYANTAAGLYNVFGDSIKRVSGEMQAFATINNVVSLAYRDHQIELDEFVQGMRFSASAANATGITFQETAAYLAVLNDNLIKSGTAGRGLQVVFSQIAGKSESIAKAFNVELDPKKSLAEQLIPMLKKVNEEFKNGDLTIAQLEKTFKSFNLRGARSFITLAQNIDDVEDVLHKFNNEAEGTSTKMTEIIKSGLANSLERTKQVFLDMARAMEGPVTTALNAVVYLASQIREGFEWTGQIGKWAGGLSLLLIVIAAVVFSIAGLLVLTATATRMVTANVSAIWSKVTAHFTERQALDAAFRAQARLNGATVAGIGAMGKLGIASRGLMAALGGPVGLFITIAMIAIPIIGAVSTSVAELNQQIQESMTALKNYSDSEIRLDKFGNDLTKIQEDMDSTAISAEVAGKRIETAFDSVGMNLVSQGELFGKTATEIANTFSKIQADAREQIAAQRLALADLKKAEYGKVSEGILDKTDATFGGTFRGRVGDLLTDDGDREKVRRYVKKLTGQIDQEFLAMRKMGDHGSYMGRVLWSSVEDEHQSALRDAKQQYRELAGEIQLAAKQADVDPEEGIAALQKRTTEALFKGNQKSADAFFKFYERALQEAAKLVEPEEFDIFEHTANQYMEMLKIIDAPLKSSITDQAVKDLKHLQTETVKTNSAIRQLRGEFSGRILDETKKLFTGGFSATTFRDVVFDDLVQPVLIDPNLIKVQLDDAVRGLDDKAKKKLVKEFAQWMPDISADTDLFDVISQSVDGLATNNKGLADEFGRVELNGTKLMGLFKVLTESTGELANGAQRAKEALAGMMTEQMLNMRGEIFGKVLDDAGRAIRAQFTINSVRKLRQELTKLGATSKGLEELSQFDLSETFEIAKRTHSTSEALQMSVADGVPEAEVQKQQNEALKAYTERVRLMGEISAKQRDLRILLHKNNAAYAKANLTLQHTKKFHEASANGIRQTLQLEAQSLFYKRRADVLAERMTGNIYESMEAMAEYVELLSNRYEMREQLKESIMEEASLRLDLLETADLILGKDKEQVEIYYTVERSLQRIAKVNSKILRLSGTEAEQQSEKLKYYKEIFEAANDLFEAEKKMTKLRKKQAEFLDDQSQAIRNIRDELRDNKDSFQGNLEKAFGNVFDSAGLLELQDIADKLGVSFTSILGDKEKAIQLLVQGVKDGTLDPAQFGADIDAMAKKMKEFHDRETKWQDQLTGVLHAQRAQALDTARAAIDSGDIEKGAKALEQFEKASTELFKGGQSEAYIRDQKELLELRGKLANVTESIQKEISVKLGLDDTQFNLIFDALQARVRELRKEIQLMGRDILMEGTTAIGVVEGNIGMEEMGYFKNDTVAKEISRSFSELNVSIKLLTTAIQSVGKTGVEPVVRSMTGGKIPGYGGGDQIPALLERGEYIIPKGPSGYYGDDFLDKIRRGEINRNDLPGFNTGGNTGKKVKVKVDSAQAAAGVAVNISNSINLNAKDIAENTRALNLLTNQTQAQAKKVSFDAKAQALAMAKNTEALESRSEDEKALAAVAPLDAANNDAKTAADAAAEKPIDKVKEFLDEAKALLEKSPISKMLMDSIATGMANGGQFVTSFVQDILVPEFAFANAKIRKEFLEQIKDIEEAYVRQFHEVELGFQRNESSYYDYINAIQDAENQRLQARAEAEEAYREQLQKTKDLFGEQLSIMSTSILTTVGGTLDSIMSSVSDSMFGSITDNLTEMFGHLALNFKELGDSIAEAIGPTAVGKFTSDMGKRISEGMSEFSDEFIPDFVGPLSSAMAGAGMQLSGMLAGGVASGIGSIVSLTSEDDGGESIVRFIEKFAEELPEMAVGFVDKLIENVDRILYAIAENLPIIMETLITEIPRFLEGLVTTLEQVLPGIISTLAAAIPQLVKALVPLLMRLLNLLILQIPEILGAVAESIPILIGEIVKNLPMLIFSIIKAVIMGVVEMVVGLVKGIFDVFGIFHDGGVIGGNNTGRRDEVPILAQYGEGVLSHRGMNALGGARQLEELNRGNNPWERLEQVRRRDRTFHTGGVVGSPKMSTISAPQAKSASGGGNTSITYQNNISIQPKIEKGMSRAEVKQQSRAYAEELEKEMSKRVQDRSSKLYDAIEKRNAWKNILL